MAGYFSSTVDVTSAIKIPGHTHWHGGTTSVSASQTKNIVTVALGVHQSAFVTFVFAATDRCCHSGGSGYMVCHLASGYEAPGSMITESIIPSQWTDLDFFPYNHSGSNTRSLRVTNNDSTYGTSTLQCYAMVQSSGGGVTYAF